MKNSYNIGLVRILFVCLAVLLFSKTDELYSSIRIEDEVSSEILIPTDEYFQTENYSFSAPETQCRVPRNSNFSISLRTFAKAHRSNPSSQSRNGFTMVKSGKSTNEYTTSLFLISIFNFPSGLNESTHHLISLGKLII